MSTVYLAGPISGKSYEEIVSRYAEKTNLLEQMGYMVLCPMTGKDYLRNEIEFRSEGYEQHPVSTSHAIFERDRWMVSQSDIVLADLSNSGDRISIGTMMELAWAALQNKHTILVMHSTNIHAHAFVYEASDIIFETLDEALEYLSKLSIGVRYEGVR